MAQHGGNKPSGADNRPIGPIVREYFTIKRQLRSSSEMLSKTAPAKLITKGEAVYCMGGGVSMLRCIHTIQGQIYDVLH